METVSFIVPLYNCLAYSQAMLESLRSSLPEGLRHEIILVDDGSTDGTREWLAGGAAGCRVVLNDRNLGYAATNNRGVTASSGALLFLLNNDLVLARGWLEPMLAAHRSLGARAGVVGNVQLDAATGELHHAGIGFDLKGKPEHDRTPAHAGETIRATPALTGACILVSRSLWDEAGGFDEGYANGCEDVDLCLKALALGRTNVVALESVVRHHISMSPGRKARDEQNTRRFVLRWRDTIASLAVRRWCSHCVHTWLHDRGTCPAPADVLLSALYLSGLRRTPPPAALREMHAAIDVELSRWRQMFDA